MTWQVVWGRQFKSILMLNSRLGSILWRGLGSLRKVKISVVVRVSVMIKARINVVVMVTAMIKVMISVVVRVRFMLKARIMSVINDTPIQQS